ncbi:hypothetical protein [Streptomyces sp. NPDC048638]|uniref:hypothetical protein n=1 Tax=Streptomyces sp. NPDC048638 TaxID=3365580 RepID=UPI0037101D59
MGKKSRGGIGSERQPDHRGLAAESHWAEPAGSSDPQSTGGWAQARAHGEAFAALYLLGAYLEYRVHGPSGPEALGPRRHDESDTDFALRQQVGTLMSGAQARLGGVPERASSLLSTFVSPTLAPGVVACLLVEGSGIFEAAAASVDVVDPQVWQSDAHRALDDMCPREHRRLAVRQLGALCRSRLAWTEQVERNAQIAPVATIHAASALVAWLYAQPSLIADPIRARLDVNKRAEIHLEQASRLSTRR